MKNLVAIFTLLAALSFCSVSPLFSQNFQKLYQEALIKEEGEGHLLEAIGLYNQIVEDKKADVLLQAKALLHVGFCYEKLGRDEATKAYQSLVNNFPGQKNEVAVARDRLNSLKQIAEKVSKASLVPKFTKIEIPISVNSSIKLSPDGKNLVQVLDNKIWKMPVSGNLGPKYSGTPVQLNTEGIDADDSGLSWSGDGKWIAFNEYPIKDKSEQGIFIVSSKGGKPKKVVENYRDARYINYRISLSPNGENLSFSTVEDKKQSVEDKKQYIQTIAVEGGNPKKVVNMQSREPAYSPNGEMIAYVEDKNAGRGGGGLGLWLVEAKGGNPRLIADAGMASCPVWSPDGKMIAYLDKSNGKQINIVTISKDGEVNGNVTSIDAPEGIGAVKILAGWTPDNKIGALLTTKEEYGLYTLSSKGGQAAMVLHDCNAMQPRWSHDGKQIFYTTPPKDVINSVFDREIASVSSNGGIGKPLPKDKEGKNIKQLPFQAGNQVSPDGKTIISAAFTPADLSSEFSTPKSRIWKIAIDGSESKKITNIQGPYADGSPCWSPDGEKVAFVRIQLSEGMPPRFMGIYIINSSGGEPEVLVSTPDKFVVSLAWSPDGKYIACLTNELKPPNTKALSVVDVSNGELRVVGEVPMVSTNNELDWSPDSKRIAFNDEAGKVIKIMNLEDGRIEDITTGLVDIDIYNLDWSPDGERFVFGGVKEGSREFWFLEDFLPLEKLAQEGHNEKNSPSQFTNTKLWDDTDTELEGAPSPDGKYLSYVDWETGDLAVYEITTGKKRRVTNKGPWNKSHDFAEYSRWSPDSKQIAYGWYNSKDDLFEIRVIEHDGSNPRILYKLEDGKRGRIYDWSPDGKNILANLEREDGTIQMALLSTYDGSVRILKTSVITDTGANWPENMCFSPDGHYIVFDLPKFKDSRGRDIFLMSVDEKSEIPIIEHPAIDQVLGWAPDGNNILFDSDRTGSPDIWTIKVLNGKPQGTPTLVKSSKGPFSPTRLGFINDGSFYYGMLTNRYDIYSTEIDPETGKIAVAPSMLIKRFIESNVTPAYSRDGKYLAYVSRRPPGTMMFTTNPVGNVLCVRSLETGEEKEFRPEINVFGWPRWSPDGHSVIVVNFVGNRNKGFYQIDTENGEVSPILLPDNRTYFGGHNLSPDGKIFIYGLVDYDVSENKSFNCQIIARNINNDEEKVIYQSKYDFRMSPSPDGKFLALLSNDDVRMKILPVTGGESRELSISEEWNDYKFELRSVSTCWSSDSKYVYVLMINSRLDDSKWELCRISTEDGEIQKLGLKMDHGGFVNPSAHPDGKTICFSARGISNSEVWVMKNFLKKEETENK